MQWSSHPIFGAEISRSRNQTSFLTTSVDNQTRNHGTMWSNYKAPFPPPLPPPPPPSTQMSKELRLSRDKINWWAIYTNLQVNVTLKSTHPRSGDFQGQKMFLATSSNNHTCNQDTKYSNFYRSSSPVRSKGLSRRFFFIYTKTHLQWTS